MFLKIVEYKSEEDKRQSMKGCFEKTKPLLQDMTNDLKKSGEWKMYLIIKPKLCHQKIIMKNVECIVRVIVAWL